MKRGRDELRQAAEEVERANADGVWQSIGPDMPRYPQVLNRTGHEYFASGRIRSLAIAPTCRPSYCRLYVGAAGGGVWRTDDALSPDPKWVYTSGSFGTNAIGFLEVDRGDRSGNTLYAGTGEPTSAVDSEAGVGIYKTIDGGDTWTLLPDSRRAFGGRGIGDIAIDPTNPEHLVVGSVRAFRGVTSTCCGGLVGSNVRSARVQRPGRPPAGEPRRDADPLRPGRPDDDLLVDVHARRVALLAAGRRRGASARGRSRRTPGGRAAADGRCDAADAARLAVEPVDDRRHDRERRDAALRDERCIRRRHRHAERPAGVHADGLPGSCVRARLVLVPGDPQHLEWPRRSLFRQRRRSGSGDQGRNVQRPHVGLDAGRHAGRDPSRPARDRRQPGRPRHVLRGFRRRDHALGRQGRRRVLSLRHADRDRPEHAPAGRAAGDRPRRVRELQAAPLARTAPALRHAQQGPADAPVPVDLGQPGPTALERDGRHAGQRHLRVDVVGARLGPDNGGAQDYLEANCPEFTTLADNAACGDYQPLGGPRGPNQAGDLTGGFYGADKTVVVPGLAVSVVSFLARCRGDANTMWAGTDLGRVFISRNVNAPHASVVWSRVDAGIPNAPGRYVSGIAVDPRNCNRAWISYSGYNANTPPAPGHVFEVTASPAGTGGVWRDLNIEAATAGMAAPALDIPATDVVRDDLTGDLYAATDFGVLKNPGVPAAAGGFTNAPGAWAPAGAGMPFVAVPSLTILPEARVLYAGTHGRGAYRMLLPGRRVDDSSTAGQGAP